MQDVVIDGEIVKEHTFAEIRKNSEVTIEGQHFVGGTLWFDDHDNLNILYEKYMSDFFYIKDFRKQVYERNKESLFYFKEKVRENSIAVTHHLPSYKSVHENYKYDNLNRFLYVI